MQKSPTPSAPSSPDSSESSASSTEPASSVPSSADAVNGESDSVSGEDSPVVSPGKARADGKCKVDGCPLEATFCYRCREVEYCDKHYPGGVTGWAKKVREGEKRERKPKRFVDSAEAPEDEGEPKVKRNQTKKQRAPTADHQVREVPAAHGGASPPVCDTSAASPVDSTEGSSSATESDESIPFSTETTESVPGSTDTAESAPFSTDASEQRVAPAFGGDIPAGSASSAFPSIDSRDAVSDTPDGEGEGGQTKRPYSQRDGNGHEYSGDKLCEPWADEVLRLMVTSKARAKEQVSDWKGTFDGAKKRRDETMTFPALIDTLVDGLTDVGEGQLEIVRGQVYFKEDELDSLKKSYNLNAKYDPGDIGVVYGKTCVKVNGVVYTVESVEAGWYSLTDASNDCSIEVDQWELLESRCSEDGGVSDSPVTLREDLRRYIRSLITFHEIMWRSFIPWLKRGQTPARGVKSVSTEGMLEDWSKRELTDEDSGRLKSVAKMRSLSKLAFVNTSVADIFHTLPVKAMREGEGGHDEAESLRDYASSEGSLCGLNGLDGLDEQNDLTDENDKKIMIKMSGVGTHGAYAQHINHTMKLLQYAYRLNRPISLQEAFLHLCPQERGSLMDHFACWEDNENEQEDSITLAFKINAVPEYTTPAMRFSLARYDRVITDLPPAVISVLSRDDGTHGTTTDRSNNTMVYTKIGKALSVCSFVMGQDRQISQQERDATTLGLAQLFEQTKQLRRDKRNLAEDEERRNSGRKGPSKKTRLGKTPFVGFSLKECLAQVELLFEGMYINGMKPVLDAIHLVDENCLGDNGWCYDILRAAEVASVDLRKKAVDKEDTEGRLRGNPEQERKIAAVVEGLKKQHISRKHFELGSTATDVRDAFSSHPLRCQGFFFRRKATLSVNGRCDSRNFGRMVVGLPSRNKVSGQRGNGFAHEHIIDRDCGYWKAVTVVIGEAFFASYDDRRDDLSPYIGAVDAEGVAMNVGRFNGILKQVGRAYLGVENLTYNQLRTACGTLVMHACTALGIPMDHPAVKDFADSILSSVEMMQKAYDVHRAVTRQSRRMELHYKGVVDFSGGVYGILKAAVEREIEMERDIGGTGAEEMGGSDGGSSAGGRDLQLREIEPAVREREKAVREREQAVKEREQAVREREQAVREREQALKAIIGGTGGSATGEHALKAKTGGAHQSQCIGEDHFEVDGKDHARRCDRPATNGTSLCADHQQKAAGGSSSGGETSDSDTGVGEKRTAEQDSKSSAKRIKTEKVREIKDGEREGMLAVLGAVKAAHARARAKTSAGGDDAEKYAKILQRMDSPRFRDGHYGMVRYLQKNDGEFSPGDWYTGSEFGTASPKENKQKSFVALKDQLTRDDAESDVADKFVWKWWTPAE